MLNWAPVDSVRREERKERRIERREEFDSVDVTAPSDALTHLFISTQKQKNHQEMAP